MFVHLFHAKSMPILNVTYHLQKTATVPTETCYSDEPNSNAFIQVRIKECSEDYSSLSS